MNMFAQQESALITWFNAVVAVAGLLLACFALWQTRRSNHTSDQANHISREANTIARQALRMQEAEGNLRLVVKPQMLHVMGDGYDSRARPVVTVINLSAFQVTIERIWWKLSNPEGASLYWKNPKVSDPFDSLPARLAPRQALTAVGIPDTFMELDHLLSITAAVASTECGESVEGMTPEWREYCDQARVKGRIHWDDGDHR
jgi:hypothetical protein